MKKKQEVRWTGDDENRHYREEGAERVRALFAGTPLLAVCTLVFFCAAYLMLKSVFHWGEFLDNVFPLLFLTVAVSVLMEARYLFGPVIRRSLPLGVLLTGSLLFVLYVRFAEGGERVLSGLCCIGSTYVRNWNSYYGTGFYMPSGEGEQIGTAVNFVMLVLCFLTVWTAKLTKDRLIPAVAPLLVFVAELLIGYTPEGWSILFLFGGVLLTNTGSFVAPEFLRMPEADFGEKDKSEVGFRYAAVAGIVLLCILVKLVGTKNAEEFSANGGAKFSSWQSNVIAEVTKWEIWEKFTAPESVEELTEELFDNKDATRAELCNDTPKYENVPVLRVNLGSEPYDSVYLIGFYADEYDDGTWKSNYKDFEKACKKAGFDSVTVTRELAELGLETIAANGLANHAEGVAMQLFYYDSDGTTAYVP